MKNIISNSIREGIIDGVKLFLRVLLLSTILTLLTTLIMFIISCFEVGFKPVTLANGELFFMTLGLTIEKMFVLVSNVRNIMPILIFISVFSFPISLMLDFCGFPQLKGVLVKYYKVMNGDESIIKKSD